MDAREYRYWRLSNANPEVRGRKLEAAIPDDRSGCWTWPGAKLKNGYGVMNYAHGRATNSRLYVHRASYEHFVGPIPDGMQIDHLCMNRACFNPTHLEAVTAQTNLLRGTAPSALCVQMNRCRKGHEFTAENTIVRPSTGQRRCRRCYNDWQAERRRRRREQAAR